MRYQKFRICGDFKIITLTMTNKVIGYVSYLLKIKDGIWDDKLIKTRID